MFSSKNVRLPDENERCSPSQPKVIKGLSAEFCFRKLAKPSRALRDNSTIERVIQLATINQQTRMPAESVFFSKLNSV